MLQKVRKGHSSLIKTKFIFSLCFYIYHSVLVFPLFRSFSFFLSAGIFDPYIPPEGDARLSTLSREGLKQRTEQLRQSAASQLAYVA